MVSFLSRFKKDADNETEANSKQHGIILESMRNSDNDLAKQVSEANAVTAPLVEAFVNSDNLEEESINNQIDELDVETLLELVKNASSAEEIQDIIAQYEDLISSLNDKKEILRSHKHIKKLLEIQAAIEFLKELSKDPQLSGEQLASKLENHINAIQNEISQQASQMLQENILKSEAKQGVVSNKNNNITKNNASDQASKNSQFLSDKINPYNQNMPKNVASSTPSNVSLNATISANKTSPVVASNQQAVTSTAYVAAQQIAANNAVRLNPVMQQAAVNNSAVVQNVVNQTAVHQNKSVSAKSPGIQVSSNTELPSQSLQDASVKQVSEKLESSNIVDNSSSETNLSKQEKRQMASDNSCCRC